jgi:Carboxypeptidase regulatory-like domain
MKRLQFLILVIVMLWGPTSGAAQALYGSLIGSVVDPANATVPGATVRVTHTGTNQSRSMQTNDAGGYSFPALTVGTYDVSIEKTGFQTFTQTRVLLTINSVVRLDAKLQVGVVAESLQVTATAPVLQTDRGEVRSELTSENFANLPIALGRNYEGLFVTLPGFAPPSNFGPIPVNSSRTLAFAVNGTSRSSNGLKIDGATAKSAWMRMTAAFSPALESIEQVNVVTNSFDAEQGLAGGAAISVNIKSGTNAMHGSAFEYHTDNALKARPFFLPANQQKPKMVFNQFGGTLSGPIKKDKLFYFASYDGWTDRRLADGIFTVPTAAIRAGDMAGSSTPIYDPATGAPDGSGRTPFFGNIIPKERQSSIVTERILPLLPLPNVPDRLTNNYYAAGVASFTRHKVDTKFNWNPNDKLTTSYRVSTTPWRVYSDSAFGNTALGGPPLFSPAWTAGNSDGSVWNAGATAAYTFTPAFIVDSYFGFTRENYNEVPGRSSEKVGLDYLKIPGTNGSRSQDGGWPRFNVNNYAAMGIGQTNVPISVHDPQYSLGTNLNWLKGGHNIRFGGEIGREEMNHWEPSAVRDVFDFSGGITTTRGGPSPNQFNSFAAFLLGLPSGVTKVTPWEEMTSRMWTYSLYLRDQWLVTRKLTVSLGARWEYYPMGTRRDRGFHNYDFNTNKLIIGGIGNNPTNAGITTSAKYVAPRVGIAYRPASSWVMRAGYGISYDTWAIIRNLLYEYPGITNYIVPSANSFTPAGTLEAGIPAVAAPQLGNGIIDMPLDVSITVPSNPYVRPYIQSWNLTLQKEIGAGFVAQAGYVASRTIHQLGRYDANSGRVLGAGLQGRPLFQKFGRTATTDVLSPYGHATYDSLQASLDRRFASGYQVRLGYTWSKNIQIGGDTLSDSRPYIQIPEYNRLNRNVSPLDVRHNFNVTGFAELPFGPNKKWANSNTTLGALLSSWQVSGVLVMYTGEPFSVTAADTSLNTPGSTQRADQVVQDVKYPRKTGPGQSWFDPLAFKPVTEVRFGTAGFNTLRGPGTFNLDFGIFRRFAIGERNLEFRAQAFNATNTPHFGNPGNNVSNMVLNPDGSIRSLGGYTEITTVKAKGRDGIDERVVQFGIRLSF